MLTSSYWQGVASDEGPAILHILVSMLSGRRFLQGRYRKEMCSFLSPTFFRRRAKVEGLRGIGNKTGCSSLYHRIYVVLLLVSNLCRAVTIQRQRSLFTAFLSLISIFSALFTAFMGIMLTVCVSREYTLEEDLALIKQVEAELRL